MFVYNKARGFEIAVTSQRLATEESIEHQAVIEKCTMLNVQQ